MDILLIILSGICLLMGLIGCIIPIIPGPPISFIGILLLEVTDVIDFTLHQLILWGGLVLLIQLLDYVIPLIGSKYAGGSKWGTWGCLIGTVIGLFFLPLGVILGPFLGAVIGELLGNKELKYALKSGLGSLLGFLLGTMFKLILCGYFIYQYVLSLSINYL